MRSNDGYHAFVKEAFIDPIRSVLIVDDDYPTYSDILDRQEFFLKHGAERPSQKSWIQNPAKIKKVIESFRKFERPLLVDIHDGDGTEGKLAHHLHQSDLLVLDYQLDGPRGDGSKAIDIARSVTKNDHFNLVVIHTSADLKIAFNEMLLGLIPPTSERPDVSEALDLVGSAELEWPGVQAAIRDAFREEQYFSARKKGKEAVSAYIRGEQPFAALHAVCTRAKWIPLQAKKIFAWAFDDFEDRARAKMHTASSAIPDWNEEEPWIRSRTAFIAFTNKTDGDVNILDELLKSLIAWGPKPSRLFLTKLRAELEAYGVAAEDAAVANNLVLARWYNDLLKGSGLARRTQIASTLSRQVEQLFDFVEQRVHDFAERLVDADGLGPLKDEKLVQFHFNVDLTNPDVSRSADLEHNAFACSKKPQGWHLQTGHIFKSGEDHWICLSPSCDLVPGQKTAGHFKDVSDDMPFFAVKLRPVPNPNKISDVHSNRYIFLDLSGTRMVFCINDPAVANSAPHWFPLYAERLGELDAEKQFFFTKLERTEGKLDAKRYEGKVISQLRYEYAINLVQTLGANFTRIGLDFVGTAVVE